jgi:UDP-N-acetylmuramoyl-tripeptide--D-alanyl-D-alanine ligase
MNAPQTLLWTTEDITSITQGSETHNASVFGVSIDTRTLKQGDLFVALKGDTGDGHEYIEQAFAAGASAALVQEGTVDFDGSADHAIIQVKDTLQALEQLAHAARERSQALRIGITGSAGKTGTKEMLGIVLTEFGKTHTSVKSYNNHWGVPLTLTRMPEDTVYGIFEMGMNHAGEIHKLTDMVRPDIAIITTILPAHIEHFATEQDIARAKAEIVDSMTQDSMLILPIDNPHYLTMYKAGEKAGLKKIYSFGDDEGADARITDLKLSAGESKVTANIMGDKVKFRLSIPGKHIALNALAVLLATKLAGLDVNHAAKTLTKAEPIEGRGQCSIITIDPDEPPVTLIDESYNANPEAMKAAFKVLELYEPKAEGRRIAVLGDMMELGPSGPKMHADLANPLLIAKADLVFTCGPQMEALHNTLPEPWRGGHTQDSFALCDAVTEAVKPGDVILVKGSLGSKMAYVVEALQGLRKSKTGQEVA